MEAVKVALDPTPMQERLLLSHAGAARFAFNVGLAHVKAALDAGERPDLSSTVCYDCGAPVDVDGDRCDACEDKDYQEWASFGCDW